MKQFIIIFTLLMGFNVGFAQEEVEQLDITTTDDMDMKLSEYVEEGKNNLLLFWASWCGICRNEKNNLVDYYESWTEDYNTEVISISTDQLSARPNAVALFESNDWPYDLIFTTGQEASDNFGVSGVPYTFLINSDNEIIWSKRSYRNGDEVTIDEKVREAFETSAVSEITQLEIDFSTKYSNGRVLLHFEEALSQVVDLKIFNIQGQLLNSSVQAKGTQDAEIVLNKSGLNTQFIVVELSTKNGEKISKLISEQ